MTDIRRIAGRRRSRHLLLLLGILAAFFFAEAQFVALAMPPKESPPPATIPDPPPEPTTVSDTPPGGACGLCTCVTLASTATRTLISTEGDTTRNIVYQQFWNYQTWLMTTFFSDDILPAMMDMAQQLTTVGMDQVMIFGTFLDAKEELDTQMLLQSLAADAHKRYQPAFEMCTIGTPSEGLANADRNGEVTAAIMAKRSIDRQLGSIGILSTNGAASDRASRLQEFKTNYCDPTDNNGGFATICTTKPSSNISINKDISYLATVERPDTIDIDLTDSTTLSNDERDIFALDANLFSHQVFDQIGKSDLTLQQNHAVYLEARSLVAKRSVAENSFFAIAGLKADGGPQATKTEPYLSAILQAVGAAKNDADLIVGNKPSYYARMDLMANRIYADPRFFSNLYDTPANIARKDTAMQAIDLMLDRDQFKSELRSETDMAVLLELELGQYHKQAQNQANWLSENGKKD